MSRRSERMAEQAAMQASEAGRVLQAQRQEKVEPKSEPQAEEAPGRKPDAPRPASRNEPRRLMMEEVVARHHREMGIKEEEEKAEAKEPPKVEPKTEEPKAEPKAEPTPEPAEESKVEEPKAETQPEAPKVVRVKVDGIESFVPESEVEEYGGVKAYQIAKAAENRLNKANETIAESKRQQAQLAQWVQMQMQPQQPQMTPDQFIASKLEAIRLGTPEEGAAALKEILARAIPRAPDPNQIIAATLMRTQQANAVDKFKEEFADVLANPLMAKLAAQEENERIAKAYRSNQVPDWPTFYRSLGNELRSVMGRQSQSAQTPAAPAQSTTSTPSQSSKEERKSSIVTLPTAAQRAAPAEEPKPETREDVLNQMRKSRGIQTG